MSFTDEQMTTIRQRLGLADDADEATILAGLDQALEERATDAPPSTALNLPEGVVAIEADVLNQLRAGAIAGEQARTEQLNAARDAAIQSAVREGRISPARVEHWQNAWDADPEGTPTVLASLPAGLVPVAELGHDDQSIDRELQLLAGPATPSAALGEFALAMGLTEEDLRNG